MDGMAAEVLGREEVQGECSSGGRSSLQIRHQEGNIGSGQVGQRGPYSHRSVPVAEQQGSFWCFPFLSEKRFLSEGDEGKGIV